MAEQRQPEFGWFRTPLAAGMLSGVAAGAVSIVLWHIVYRDHGTGSLLPRFAMFPGMIVVEWPIVALVCSGPVIARRNLRVAGQALLWSLGLSIADAIAYAAWGFLTQILYGIVPYPYGFGLAAWGVFSVVRAGVSGALVGLVLTRLYGFKPYARSALVWGAVGSIVVGVLQILVLVLLSGGLLWGPDLTENPEQIPARVMSALIGTVVVILFPTWAIERAMRQRPPPTLDAAAQNG